MKMATPMAIHVTMSLTRGDGRRPPGTLHLSQVTAQPTPLRVPCADAQNNIPLPGAASAELPQTSHQLIK